MDERQMLQQQLDMAQTILAALEQQAAAGDPLLPLPLQMQLSSRRTELSSLEARLAQLEGQADAVPDNLPPRETIFIGRQQALARCLDALQPEQRGWGVMLTGMGGLGKTALALEVAHEARRRAWFDAYLFASAKTARLTADGVQQDTLTFSSLDAFIRTFARLLGWPHIAQIPDTSARRQALLEALCGRRSLLIWDNLETLSIDEQHLIVHFLEQLPAPSKAMVTSRRHTETGSLQISVDRLTPTEAFAVMDEIGRRQPRVADALHYTGEITRQALYDITGGNPLAIHWTLGLITHQGVTLPYAIERVRDAGRSPDLYGFLFATAVAHVSHGDQSILAALAAFQTPTTASVLTEVIPLTTPEITFALERLVTLALVHVAGEDLYTLHPLARTYMQTALHQESPGALTPDSVQHNTAVYQHSLRYWVNYAYRYGQDHYATFTHLEEFWPNLEATATALYDVVKNTAAPEQAHAARLLLSLSTTLSVFCLFRGYWDEGIHIHTWAYEAAQTLQAWPEAGWRAYDVARVYYYRGETDRAAMWSGRMTVAMQQSGTRRDQAVALGLNGLVALQQGNLDEAERGCLEALAASLELGTEHDQAVLLNDLGGVARSRRDLNRAENYFRRSLTLAEKLGDQQILPSLLGNLGRLTLDTGRLEEATTWYTRQLALAHEIGRQDVVAIAQTGLACVLAQAGDYVQALPYAQAALHLRLRLRDRALDETRHLVARLQQHLDQSQAPADSAHHV